MESWMINVIGAVATIIAGYAVLRKTVAGHEEKFKEMRKEHAENIDHMDKRINAGFKRLDETINRTTILEQSTKEHLGLREAEDRFVSHKELALHLTNMEASIKHLDKGQTEMKQEMGKKLDYLTELLSTNIVKTITPHGAVFGGK